MEFWRNIKIKPNDQSLVGRTIRKENWEGELFFEVFYIHGNIMLGDNQDGEADYFLTESPTDNWQVKMKFPFARKRNGKIITKKMGESKS
jgi:hypothetical protein